MTPIGAPPREWEPPSQALGTRGWLPGSSGSRHDEKGQAESLARQVRPSATSPRYLPRPHQTATNPDPVGPLCRRPRRAARPDRAPARLCVVSPQVPPREASLGLRRTPERDLPLRGLSRDRRYDGRLRHPGLIRRAAQKSGRSRPLSPRGRGPVALGRGRGRQRDLELERRPLAGRRLPGDLATDPLGDPRGAGEAEARVRPSWRA
jgi:hypothetical protein